MSGYNAQTYSSPDGVSGLKIEADIRDADGWIAFCAVINAQAAILWPEPEPESKPARKSGSTGPKLVGPPAEGTFDAKVLEWARTYAKINGCWPGATLVADAFDLSNGIAAMRIGRLKKRGVWGAQ